MSAAAFPEMRTLRRTLDPALLNSVVNHPDVRPFVCLPAAAPVSHCHDGNTSALDVTPLVANPANVALVNNHGGFILHKIAAATYELHTQFLPEGRGDAFRAAAAEGLRYLFTATDALEVVTKVPAFNVAADKAAQAAGFTPRFEQDGAWIAPDGSPSNVSYRGLSFDAWRAQDAEIAAVGRWFHERLEAAKAEAGSPLPTHPDDDAHDRAAGATAMMLRAGNPLKAVESYNRWAALAGYQLIGLVSVAPTVVDVGDAVIEVRNDDMEILLCR